MRIYPASIARRTALALAAGLALHSTAGAQVSATFFTSYPGAAPDPDAPFNGGSIICSTTIGSIDGFFVNFTDPGVRASLCPNNPNALNPANRIFGARFVGTLWSPTAGTFDMPFSADDGEKLTVNGATIINEWSNVKGGGPGDFDIPVNAGENSFVLDYNNKAPSGAFVRFQSGNTPVAFAPEPSSVVLMGSGLLAMGGAGWRRRRRAA